MPAKKRKQPDEKAETMMRLDPHDLSLFYTLHKALMFFVNQRLDVIEKPLDSPEQVGNLPPDDGLKLRDALLANMDLIDAFASREPIPAATRTNWRSCGPGSIWWRDSSTSTAISRTTRSS